MSYDISKTTSEIENVDWSTGTGSGQHYNNARLGSGSSQASQSSGDICRICHCESDPKNLLLTPCYCAGSLKYVHQACLQQWLTASETNSCELCKFPFIMHTKIKPFNEWRSLDISGVERRRLCCSILFHCAAALCVIWSLCVLIERAADDVKRGLIDWPFWTKLAVVTVGLTGGVVFMYIQCKAYLHLCHRWKARNRILLIQNAPEKVHPLSQPSPNVQRQQHHHHQQQQQQQSRCIALQQDMRRNNSRRSHLNAGQAFYGGSGGVGGMCGGADVAANAPRPSMLGGSGCGGARVGAGVSVAGDNAQRMMNAMDTSAPYQHSIQHLNMSGANGALHIDDDDDDAAYLCSDGNVVIAPSSASSSSQPGQIVANIECSQSQQNYERDWALDDVVSQISSFRPCPQGSGSMTPFLDSSIHNVLAEHSQSCSSSRAASVNDVCGCGGSSKRDDLSTGGISSTDTGRERGAMQLMSSISGSGGGGFQATKEPSMSSDVSSAVANGLGGFVYKPQSKRFSNSSIFLENRDILNDNRLMQGGIDLDGGGDSSSIGDSIGIDGNNDSCFSKFNYRHSCVLTTHNNNDNAPHHLEDCVPKDLRRYSDTKLLASDTTQRLFVGDPINIQTSNPPVIMMSNNDTSPRLPSVAQRRRATILDMELLASPLTNTLNDTFGDVVGRQHKRTTVAAQSMQTVEHVGDRRGGAELEVEGAGSGQSSHYKVAARGSLQPAERNAVKGRFFFKSLPNLSSSCESLIKN